LGHFPQKRFRNALREATNSRALISKKDSETRFVCPSNSRELISPKAKSLFRHPKCCFQRFQRRLFACNAILKQFGIDINKNQNENVPKNQFTRNGSPSFEPMCHH
jgi:hypothetical protein